MSIYPVGLDSGLTHIVVYDFCFWYCIEGSGEYHEVTDDFTEFSDLNIDIPEDFILDHHSIIMMFPGILLP